MEKTKKFSHFGGELNEGIRATLAMGDRINNFFTQAMGVTLSLHVQIIFYALIWVGTFNNYSKEQLRNLIQRMEELYQSDEGFKNQVDSIIESSTEFNKLLGEIGSKAKSLVSAIEK